jgi:hypothetical protein
VGKLHVLNRFGMALYVGLQCVVRFEMRVPLSNLLTYHGLLIRDIDSFRDQYSAQRANLLLLRIFHFAMLVLDSI